MAWRREIVRRNARQAYRTAADDSLVSAEAKTAELRPSMEHVGGAKVMAIAISTESSVGFTEGCP
jgi:hypothetical protein